MTCETLSNSLYLSKPERNNYQWSFMHFHFCVPQFIFFLVKSQDITWELTDAV